MNDGTVEGVCYRNMPVFTVPISSRSFPSPNDTAYLFDRFLSMIDDFNSVKMR